MPSSSFKVGGYISGVRAAVSWKDGEGFTDKSGRLADMIAAAEQVCGSPTGPCYAAGDSPGVVAMLTALAMFDRVVTVTGGDDIFEELRALMALPDGAIA